MGRKPKQTENENNVDPAELDPIIEGLLLKLPEPGAYWPPQERAAWVALLQGALGVIYKDKPPDQQA